MLWNITFASARTCIQPSVQTKKLNVTVLKGNIKNLYIYLQENKLCQESKHTLVKQWKWCKHVNKCIKLPVNAAMNLKIIKRYPCFQTLHLLLLKYSTISWNNSRLNYSKRKQLKKKGEHLSTETNTCNVKTRVQHTKVKIKIMQTCKKWVH